MIPIISLVTSVKDYIEVVHKLIESDSTYSIQNYNELGSIFTYSLISLKNTFIDVLSLNWFKTNFNLPIMVPEISSAMISEISVLDGYFHNTFQFLDTPLSYGPKNSFVYGLEKFVIGLINSCFFIIPTSTAHIITLRRFVMQGLEAGYIAGVGTIAGNIFWIGSIILGCRFFVIPWLSLDIFRYVLGFMLLIKYMWDSYNERRMVLEDLSKQKIFLLSFLLALTEQTSIYPFISNLSVGPESSILESFPADNYSQFLWVHCCYLLGLLIGSFSLLHLTCWFWENPAFKLYMWVISSFKVSTSLYSKVLNFGFLYLTMICAITSIPYYGLDYTLTNPLGFVSDDRIIDAKLLPETAFINTKASDKNTRRNRGRHGRRERWKRRVRKYRTFDASLYDQGVYDLFTVEDLNYGFDRFWLRRKIRNHRVRFRFFPGPWMRSFKKQLSKPRLESYAGPRQEFFRILFEQVYHPSFHKYNYVNKNKKEEKLKLTSLANPVLTPTVTPPLGSPLLTKDSLSGNPFLTLDENSLNSFSKKETSIYLSTSDSLENQKTKNQAFTIKKNLYREHSTLRKFVRKVNNRLKTSEIIQRLESGSKGLKNSKTVLNKYDDSTKGVYSKRWKEIFSKIQKKRTSLSTESKHLNGFLTNFYTQSLSVKPTLANNSGYIEFPETNKFNMPQSSNVKKQNSLISNVDKSKQVLHYKSLFTPNLENSQNLIKNSNGKGVLLHPLNYYLKKEKAFQAKLNYYTPTVFRQFSIENNAPYFRVMMKRYFYYYKPTLRWKKTMKVASLRKARRKSSRVPRKLQYSETTLGNQSVSNMPISNQNLTTSVSGSQSSAVNSALLAGPLSFNERLKQPTSNYTIVGKRASRYRYQIYKDVLQHWYYSPFNRFLLKLDVDSFIRRQPNSHFLTKNEENLIHLRRFLLSEHYNTLRWYTYMQHYRSMKTRIGGTKSFSSTAYNQQFQGTFKKIRHLFAITPSGLATQPNSSELNPKTVLKFDQPLYNESYNTSNKTYLNTFLIHEELFGSSRPLDDLVSQSTGIVREYLTQAAPLRQQIIQDLIQKRNFTELTQFLYSGQKTRGTKPVTNNRDLYNQEQYYLLNTNEKQEIQKFEKEQIKQYLRENNLKGDLWINLLKKWKRRVNDQEFMKNYIARRVEKREKREQKKQALLEKKLVKLTNWLKDLPTTNSSNLKSENSNKLVMMFNLKPTESIMLSSGAQKAINEGISSLANLNSSSGSTILNPQERAIWKASTLLQYKKKLLNQNISGPIGIKKLNLENLRFYENLRKEQEIQTSLTSISTILQQVNTTNLVNKSKKSLNLKSLLVKATDLTQYFKRNIEQYLGLRKVYSLVLPAKRKSFKAWKQKERALNKQKKSRKEFKSLSSIITKKKPIRFKNEYYFNSDISSANTTAMASDNALSKNLVTSFTISKKRDDTPDQKAVLESSNSKTFAWGSQYFSNQNFFTKQFKRKKSPQRRARIRRNRGVIRKRTLADSLKREFRNLRRYGETVDNDSKTQKILDKINTFSLTSTKGQNKSTSNTAEPNMLDQKQQQETKSSQKLNWQSQWKLSRSKQRKQRTWKQKRSKYSQKLRKYKKRRRNVLGKIRILSKQLKRVQSKVEIQNWWWKNFLPSIRANSDALWQIEKDRQIREKLEEFSVSEILKRDSVNLNSVNGELQIGNTDFKPLFLPQAMRLKESLANKSNSSTKDLDVNTTVNEKNLNLATITSPNKEENQDLIGQLYENLLLSKTATPNQAGTDKAPFLTMNTSIPFYAGWDESLRKFVVTNRLLSRRQTGFELSLNNSNQKDSTISAFNPLLSVLEAREKIKNEDSSTQDRNLSSGAPVDLKMGSNSKEQIIEFTSAPLKGMNAATTLYWQIPFTTYDPDQFFALGMDGFAPIGWKRFNFRHTILKSWLYYLSSGNTYTYLNLNTPSLNSTGENKNVLAEKKPILVKKETTFNTGNSFSSASIDSTSLNSTESQNPLIYKLNRKNNLFSANFSSTETLSFNSSNSIETNMSGNKIKRNLSRRLKKRNRRVKKHPRAPVWFPSGPLLNQVLPVHYIYVFYKRSRVPRDRYIKRRLQKNTNKTVGITDKEQTTGPLSPALLDYTLRKRVKTKRKYHRKKDLTKKMPIFPRRAKFLGADGDSIYWRPMSRQKLNKSIGELVREQRLLRNKQRKKEGSASNKQPSLRVKQLRRRVQRQIIRTVWRYKPRAGGFVWPGDYLRLELVKAPKLQQPKFDSESKSKIKGGGNESVGSLVGTIGMSEQSKQTPKTKRKKKRTLQEWQIQPKKYLLEKHNLRVLKKKLEKANRSSKIKQRIKELNYLV
uniref:Hypothetical chloroplast RF1 n=1 Tax=Phacotus lenticularis TaxID=52965 RepID=A0A0S2LQD3_9CHLO|nr:hypothetical chloroplast RF1 [Phacotus lenticularis]ALO63627.1 hypothetical chloroplast RF1 [Phacotus lenticularis]